MPGSYFSPSIQTPLCTLSNYLLRAAWNVAWLRLAKLVLGAQGIRVYPPDQLIVVHHKTSCSNIYIFLNSMLMRFDTKDNSPGFIYFVSEWKYRDE